ncbi:MAG: hypothetical protein EXQ89_06435 [Rhodospirillaceae bacterium]|nr:hypothetical protein [Rhodospirillaceae bacterium]
MTLVAAALQSALAHHRAGRLPEAEASYRRILAHSRPTPMPGICWVSSPIRKAVTRLRSI